tara:strand:- start:413 stop:529 length:117 start_codon:yes stop_codon:yes gene_type:complete
LVSDLTGTDNGDVQNKDAGDRGTLFTIKGKSTGRRALL